jgi:hypothetical protein
MVPHAAQRSAGSHRTDALVHRPKFSRSNHAALGRHRQRFGDLLAEILARQGDVQQRVRLGPRPLVRDLVAVGALAVRLLMPSPPARRTGIERIDQAEPRVVLLHAFEHPCRVLVEAPADTFFVVPGVRRAHDQRLRARLGAGPQFVVDVGGGVLHELVDQADAHALAVERSRLRRDRSNEGAGLRASRCCGR